MSDLAPAARRFAAPLYALIAAIALVELAIAWLAFHPNVSADYRGFYIDKTTTCLNQPVSGAYVLGTTISFLPDGYDLAKPVRVCGWTSPTGDGTQSLGETSRLRFALPDTTGPLALTLELSALARPEQPTQRVIVSANGTEIGSFVADSEPQAYAVDIPPAAVADPLEIILAFPDSQRVSPNAANIFDRAIQLRAVTLSAR